MALSILEEIAKVALNLLNSRGGSLLRKICLVSLILLNIHLVEEYPMWLAPGMMKLVHLIAQSMGKSHVGSETVK